MSTPGREAALKRLRVVGFIEGISFLVLLLVAMPLKYLAGQPDAVRIIGTAHGVLWVVYLVVLALAWQAAKWPFMTAFLGGLASVLPLGPWWFDSYLRRSKEN